MNGFLGAIFRSVTSLIGALLTTFSAFTFLVLWGMSELNPSFGGGYAGIVTFLLLPVVFVLGLLLMPLGLWRLRKKGEGKAPVIDLNLPRTRLTVITVVGLTVVNVTILSIATYKGVETMDSVEFCGAACHSVMNPEHTAYQRSQHSKVRCTKCHIGSGAEWFVKGKASGVRQLFSIFTHSYSRPIPTPVDRLRPANETCGQCHSRNEHEPDRLHVIDRFAEDEDSTWKKTVLVNRVAAVHWHIDQTVRFTSDPQRRVMSEVELALADGGVRRWRNTSPRALDAGVVTPAFRTMDCTDCHNRPAHTFQRPKDEVDRALANGTLDRTLPFIRREALRTVTMPWTSAEQARSGIAKELHDFYATTFKGLEDAEPGRIDAAARALAAMWEANVFPSMNIGWKTYPNFRDHEDDEGCFRCHTSDLESSTASRISGRCELCHLTLAEEEENPEVLDSLSDE